jgi:prephenate dehydrogenase
MSFGTIAILGPGLIGGSLALALAERGLAGKLVIWARKEDSFPAIREKLPQATLTTDIIEAVRTADIVVLCVPIETMKGLVEKFADALKPTALVTDVGSVKESVDREIAPLLAGKALWVGSHPMAGSEQAGFAAARANLFRGAFVILTPTNQTQKQAEQRAEEFWSLPEIGGRIVKIPPQNHDIKVAQISHLPHLLAAVLVNHVQHADSEALQLVGGGFRDTTRIASGSPELWAEILSANARAVAHALNPFIEELKTLKNNLENSTDKVVLKQRLLEKLKEAQEVRSKILKDT